jgi:diguanylate cyclase (GGDEF)-like protein
VPAECLSQLLGESEDLSGLMADSAGDLASVNTCVRRVLENSYPLLQIEIDTAVAEIAAVTRKLQQASERLTAMKESLHIEVRDRVMVDHQFAAAVEQEEGSRTAALHDTLTDLPNRVLFMDRLEHGIAHAKRDRRMLAVMFLDLNNFKVINDTHGHQAGDAVLRIVATRLKHTMRKDDTVSRYGGDEFLCLLTQLHEEKDIAMIAAKISKAIQEPCSVSVGDVIVSSYLEASIGISVFPRDGSNANALISAADEAMYWAKENKSGFAFAQ